MRKFFYVVMAVFIFVSVLINALEKEKKKQIKDIKCIGNERIGNQTIKFYIKLEPGSFVDSDDIDSIIKNLYKTRLFAHVNAFIDNEKNLIIKVQENPLINKLTLKGNKLFTHKELLNNIIQSKPLTIFTETKLQNDLLNLIKTYTNNGKIGTKIEYELNKLNSNRINLVLKIKEGKTSRIKNMRFIGNKIFSEKELKQAIKMQSNDLFNKLFKLFFKGRDYYSPQYLLISEELLNNFYSSKGYINSNIQPIVEIDDNNQVMITFLIDEGDQYLFGSSKIDIEAGIQNERLKKEMLELIIEKDHKVFDRNKIISVIEKINRYLNEKGYIFAKINPEYIQHDNVVDVIYVVVPGKKIYIDRIIIEGNDRTSDNVIRSKLYVAEGDPYDTFKVQKSHKKLIENNFFESVRMNNYAVNDDMVNLHLNIKEKNTVSLYLGGGMSFPGGIFFKTDFKDPNLFGNGKELSFAIEKSQYVFSTDLKVIESNYNDSDTLLAIGIFYEKQDKPNVTFNSCDMGFFTKLSYKFTENLTHSLRYYYKYHHIYLNDKDGKYSDFYKKIRDDNRKGKHYISSVGYTLTYNKLDNLYAPNNGYLFRLSQDISGLGGNVHFFKSEFFSFYAHPILSNIDHDIIFRFKMAAGNIFSYSNRLLDTSEHFFKGSNEIRGFSPSGIGPRAKDKSSLGGKTYFNLTQQVDFPLPRLSNLVGIKGSFFVDYATLFDLDYKDQQGREEKSYNDGKLMRVSPGFGFSIPSPFGGRFRLDFGFPLVKETYDIIPSSNVQFSIEVGI
ncbi:MAG: outer membrane protein assembly factor BamA [Wolbachia endosymbiont of Meromenopon meropis]|nr:outer membrane protein assembly factor BamA [Wolbachia endosymbiont of Meromenopon meropis]